MRERFPRNYALRSDINLGKTYDTADGMEAKFI